MKTLLSNLIWKCPNIDTSSSKIICLIDEFWYSDLHYQSGIRNSQNSPISYNDSLIYFWPNESLWFGLISPRDIKLIVDWPVYKVFRSVIGYLCSIMRHTSVSHTTMLKLIVHLAHDMWNFRQFLYSRVVN